MQIIFRATTATTALAGAALTTGNAQRLPSWAPPIQYCDTTGVWTAYILGGGETTFPNKNMKIAKGARVRAYGRVASLYAGAECVALSREIFGSNADKLIQANLIILTYRALGEIARP